MAKESFRERQEAELEVLNSIYDQDVQDLRERKGKWTPLDIKIALTPLQGSNEIREVYAKISLHIKCGPKYPRTAPKIMLEDSKGLSDAQVSVLYKQLQEQADQQLKGEVMIYELTQTIQAFLHQNNKPPLLSFYDEMKKENLKREQDLKRQKTIQKEQERQVLKDQVQKMEEQLKKEPRIRRDTRRSLSESKRTHSGSESSDISPQKTAANKDCAEHRRSDTLYFHNVGRKIQKGCCLGHSAKGCVCYPGVDLGTGQLLYVTEWNIKYSDLETKCLPNCGLNRSISDQKCNGHSPDDFIAYIEKQVTSLANLQHRNLVDYECVLSLKKKDGIVIYLAQDFVLGTSVSGVSSAIGWSSDGTSTVAKGVVDALIYLHNNSVSHSWLYDTSVFMDNNGRIRVSDFGLIAFLQELIGGNKTFKSDLVAFGTLIESLSINISAEMKDFIEKCRSDRTLSASDLLDHPFLCPVVLDANPTNGLMLPMQTQQPSDRPTAAIVPFQTPVTSETSRIANEFQILTYLGRGAYGDVLKVRNILDNRQYAIKRIPLPARSRQLYRKMTREVELLSRLNHENVVRYFTSWIEIGKLSDEGIDKEFDQSECSMSLELDAKKQSNRILVPEASSDSSSDDWIVNCLPNRRIGSSSDDGIEFANSDGEVMNYEDDDNADSEEETNQRMSPRNPKPMAQYMYIQMEFCEKSTLRTAIDSNLYQNQERGWRLFREIAEGLAHIHQQGMIHRDLKPVNIFLDSRDQVKIGDFGLATTNILALQSQDHNTPMPAEVGHSSQTGKVGTALYVAPELCGQASKSTYNQKVDLYSMGIILFEMSSPPATTAMERVTKILQLRTPKIVFPDDFLVMSKYAQHIQVIRWLLNHDPALRPTSEELLSSELVPPTKLEAAELEEMIRHVLANPQSRTYKHLIAKSLSQESTPVCQLTYHMGMVPILASFEFVKTKVMNLFRKHGGIEVEAPLLTPYVNIHNTNSVKLMTHSGSVVMLPHDLRLPFVRHIAINGINHIRRYSISRVYREKKVHGFHPKQLYECAFDIITPNRGNLLIDAELLTIAHELLNSELPALGRNTNHNISFRINHTTLLKSILLYCNVPKDKYKDLLSLVADYMENRISKFQLTSSINSLLQNFKHNTTTLLDFLQTDTPINHINISPLRILIRGRGEAASLAQNAIRELETVIQLVQGMISSSQVMCQMHIVCGMSIGFDRAKTGGIIWQMVGNLKPERHGHNETATTIAVGGRYDGLLAEIQKTAQNSGLAIPVNREISGAGLSFALDKLVYALGGSNEYQSIEVVICVCGSRPPLKDVTQILKALWAVGIRTGIIESINEEEMQDLAKESGASHVILLGEGGVLRVQTWCQDRFQEKYVTRPELIDYIQTKLRPPETSVSENFNPSHLLLQTSTSLSAISMKNNSYNPTPYNSSVSSSMPALELVFMTSEKFTVNKRKRYENQIGQNLASSLNKFVKKEKVVVVVVDLVKEILKAIAAIIDPRDVESNDSFAELQTVIERFPKQKKYISEIFDEISETLSEPKAPILGLYSIADSYYRLII